MKWPLKFLVTACAIALAGCGSDDDDAVGSAPGGTVRTPTDPPPPDPAECPDFVDAGVAGAVQSPLIIEASGLVASRAHPGVFWVNNDSGDGPRLYALAESGKHLGVYTLSGASAADWEAIAIGPGPVAGQDYLYVGDIGDNGNSRSFVTVYRVAEPAVSAGQAPVTATLQGVSALPMRYPDGSPDAETLLCDPVSGDLFLITKDLGGDSNVYRAAAPHAAGATVALEWVAAIDFTRIAGRNDELTAGDVSPDGSLILLRTYRDVYLWCRDAGRPLWEAFASPPRAQPQRDEPQGEAITFGADARAYYTLSEGSFRPLYRFVRP